MRKQYHFRPSKNGFFAWDVHRLVELTKSHIVLQKPLNEIAEFDEAFWYCHGDRPTCRSIAEHSRLISECDLSFPIILCSRGRVMDGMHRICKAFVLGHDTIKAVQFFSDPLPDFEDVQPEELPYD